MTIFYDILFINPDRVTGKRALPVMLTSGEVIGACALRKVECHVFAVFCINEEKVHNHPFYYHFLYAGVNGRSTLSRILVERIYSYNNQTVARN